MNVTRIVAALVAVGFVAGSAMAQTKAAAAPVAGTAEGAFLKKGTIVYGGNVGYSVYSVEAAGMSGQASLLKVNGTADYFVMDNLSVGLAGNVDWLRGKLNDVGVANATLAYGELVARYYFPVCNDRLIPYAGASLGAGYGIVSINPNGLIMPGGSTSQGNSITTWGLQTGFLVPLNDTVLLDTCIKYTDYQLPDSASVDMDGLQISMGLKIKL